VGNPTDAAGFETSGGLALRVERAAMVSVTGGVAEITIEHGPPLGWGSPVVLPAGARVRVGRLTEGARLYVSVRGGITLDGDVAHVGADPVDPPTLQAAARREPSTTVGLWPGPRRDWFTDGAWATLFAGAFTVTNTSRVGVRLTGPMLVRRRDGELPSEGLVEGAVQVPPDGLPIVMLADHPTTGGYPVIAVVDPADLGAVAQAGPGVALRFVRR
jgi:allophanate hydrolase subunit 2